MEKQSPIGWIRTPLTMRQIFILEGASEIFNKNVEEIIADQVEIACRMLAPRVYAKELYDFSELYKQSLENLEYNEDSPFGLLKDRATDIADFILTNLPDLIEQEEEEEVNSEEQQNINWLDDVIKESKEYKHDPDGPKDIRDK